MWPPWAVAYLASSMRRAVREWIPPTHQNGEESLSDGEEVIVRWFPLEGRKNVERLFEEESDGVGTHGCLGGFFWGRAGGVEDCFDNDQRECVGSGKLGRFAVFGDMAARIRGSNGNSGTGSLVGIMLELDFHCRGELAAGDSERIDKLSMKKSSIGGNQYLDYL